MTYKEFLEDFKSDGSLHPLNLAYKRGGIKAVRKYLKLTQKAMSEKIGCSARSIENWESEGTTISRKPPDWTIPLILFALSN